MAPEYEDSRQYEYCPDCGTPLLDSRCPNCAHRQTESISESYAPGITVGSEHETHQRRDPTIRTRPRSTGATRPVQTDEDDESKPDELNGTIVFSSPPYKTFDADDREILTVKLVFVVQDDGTVTQVNIWADPDAAEPFTDLPALAAGTPLYASGYGDEFRGLDVLQVHLGEDHQLEQIPADLVAPPTLPATPIADLDPGIGRVNLRAEIVGISPSFHQREDYPDAIDTVTVYDVILTDDTGTIKMEAFAHSIPTTYDEGDEVGVLQVEIKSADESDRRSVKAAAWNDAVFVDPDVLAPPGA